MDLLLVRGPFLVLACAVSMTEAVVRMACRLLSEGELSVAEVSSRVGYADVPSFVRAFKALSGVTPGRFGQATPPLSRGHET